MKFKVGDRVKRARHPRYFYAENTKMPIGATGIVSGFTTGVYHDYLVSVAIDGGKHWDCDPATLEPLTPPASDAWATDAVRKVTKPVYTEPERVKVTT